MTAAFFDTNILVSAIVNPSGKPGVALSMAARGEFDLFISEGVFEELADVLKRPFFLRRIGDPLLLARYLDLVVASFPFAPVGAPAPVEIDPEDEHVVSSALACGADFLVTGDERHLLPIGRIGKLEIVNATRFLDMIAEQ